MNQHEILAEPHTASKKLEPSNWLNMFNASHIESFKKRVWRTIGQTWMRKKQQLEMNDQIIIHSTHHKTGTVLFQKIFEGISKQFDMPMFFFNEKNYNDPLFYRKLTKGTICFDDHSRVLVNMMNQPFKGTHMVRDPREVVISGYFYHLTTTEKWCLEPKPNLGGKSYQEHINSLDQEQGILYELGAIGGSTIREMACWDYSNPNFLELRFEDVQADFDGHFERIFNFYGFPQPIIDICMEIARSQDLSRMSKEAIKKNSHVTNKNLKEAKWKSVLTPSHKKKFKELYGDLLIKLGYEKNNDW